MTEPEGTERSGPEQGGPQPAKAEPDWERRRRLAAIFGEVLPETTGDERDPGAGPQERAPGPGQDPADRWLEEQVPPHHG